MEAIKTKKWFVVFVLALTAVGAMSSYASHNQTFYKGAFPASVLNASEAPQRALPETSPEELLPSYLVPEVTFTDREKAAAFQETHAAAVAFLDQGASALKILSEKLAVSVAAEKAEAQSKAEAKKKQEEAKIIVAAPCQDRGVPILKDGKIAGCSQDSTLGTVPISAQKALPLAKPGPVVKIIEENSMEASLPLSCESQKRYTYTGEDRPGILYGMCLDCGTASFIKNGGRCL